MKRFVRDAVLLIAWNSAIGGPCAEATDAPVAHWRLAGDPRDASASGWHGVSHGVDFSAAGPNGSPGTAARFDGRASYIELPTDTPIRLGTGDFSIAVWVHTDRNLDDVLGDVVSQYDAKTRTGFQLGIQNNAGVVSAQSNYRHLQFGIDSDHIDPHWTDCGRPGNSVLPFALCVYRGSLYAGTFETAKGESGHVYRYDGGKRWIDCGSPDRCNAVQALAVFDGRLYAGAGRYLAAGSALPESPNEHPGGRVYRYEGGQEWTDCGSLQNAETGASFTVGGMAVYRGALYAGVSKPPGRGLYRFDGMRTWTYCGNPGHRVTNPVVFNGKLYCCSLDGGGVARYDGGTQWTDVGRPKGVSQTYGFAIYRGELYASSWPNGEVFVYDGGTNWRTVGRLGTEKEVMGMAVYNGKLFGGTLPLAEVYRYEGGENWTRTGQLDTTPDVRYRRAWSMAVFGGRLFCGTLPSGHVHAIEAGRCVTHDHALPAGWIHVAAIRGEDRLRLYVDGEEVAQSSGFDRRRFDLSPDVPWRIGFGPHDYFRGRLSDLRLYDRALTPAEIRGLAAGG